VNDMEFSSWPVEELEALARVYLKHKQFQKAQPLRIELASRLQTNENDSVRQLFEQLDDSNVVSLTDRIFGKKKFA
jgi:trans-2-enoyl-CoA reductase